MDDDGEQPTEYRRFEVLARTLVRVPTKEIEHERDREQARKG